MSSAYMPMQCSGDYMRGAHKANLFWGRWPMSDEGFLYSIHLNGCGALDSHVTARSLIYPTTRQDGSLCKTRGFYANHNNTTMLLTAS